MLGAVEQERSHRETRGVAECFFDFSSALHLPQCLYHSMWTQADVLYAFYKIFLNILYNHILSMSLSSDINMVASQSVHA